MAQIDDYKNAISLATIESLPDLIPQIYEFCRARKGRPDPASLIQERLHPAVKQALTTELKELIQLGPPREVVSEEISAGEALKKSVPMQRDVAMAILDPLFKQVYSENQGITICEVIDAENKILRPMSNESSVKKLMEGKLAKAIEAEFEAVHSSIRSEMLKQWEGASECIPKPKVIAPRDSDEWSFFKPLLDLEPGPFPVWQGILNRLSDPDAFCAWIYGVWSGEYKGRLCVWMLGEGEIGKSATGKAIGNLFPNVSAAVDNSQMKGNNHFLLASFLDTRIIIYPDANNTSILRTELFKSLCSAGADKLPIQPKGQKTYFEYINAYMFIISNHHPVVSNDKAGLSRILLIKMDEFSRNEKPDPSAPERIKTESAAFLYHARECYRRLCPNNYTIETLPITKELIGDTVRDTEELYYEVFDSNFVLVLDKNGHPDKSVHVKGQEMRDILNQNNIPVRDQKDFHKWLEKTHNIVKTNIPVKNTKAYYGIKLGEGGVGSAEPSQCAVSALIDL